MKRIQTMKWFLILSLVNSAHLLADESNTLSPEDYLKVVRTKNEEIRGAIAASEGALKRSEEAELMTSTAVFANAEYAQDGMLPVMPFFTQDSINTQRLSLGVKKTTTFGLDAKFYYLMRHTNYVNMSAGFPPIKFYDTRPTLELTQSLWSNGFGRSTRANQAAAEAGALASSYAQSYKVKSLLAAAEDSYWGLVLAREKVEVTHIALEQAQKTYKWSSERVKRNLADDVDGLQAKAALEVRQLEMQVALDEERSAARMFNRFRSENSDVVTVQLAKLSSEELIDRKIHDTKPQRDDVKAAEQQQKAAIAAASASIEKTNPTLDVSAMYGLNGRNPNAASALGDPFGANRPSFSVGLNFAMPLDRGLASEAAAGYRKEQMGAEMTFRQKQTDLMNEWSDLKKRIAEFKVRLKLTQGLVAAQKAKLALERERLNTGRTTTFQVLMFEQDYAQSKLGEIGAKAALVRALTQLKVYGGSL